MVPPSTRPIGRSKRGARDRQIAWLSSMSGISRRLRRSFRIQPQFRDDCSPPILPFSQSTTGVPRSASQRAALTPTMPPPITTTSVRTGRGRTASQGNETSPFMWSNIHRRGGGTTARLPERIRAPDGEKRASGMGAGGAELIEAGFSQARNLSSSGGSLAKRARTRNRSHPRRCWCGRANHR